MITGLGADWSSKGPGAFNYNYFSHDLLVINNAEIFR